MSFWKCEFEQELGWTLGGVLTLPADVPRGQTILLMLLTRNSALHTITDSAGNTYTQLRMDILGVAPTYLRVYQGFVGRALWAGDTITASPSMGSGPACVGGMVLSGAVHQFPRQLSYTPTIYTQADWLWFGALYDGDELPPLAVPTPAIHGWTHLTAQSVSLSEPNGLYMLRFAYREISEPTEELFTYASGTGFTFILGPRLSTKMSYQLTPQGMTVELVNSPNFNGGTSKAQVDVRFLRLMRADYPPPGPVDGWLFSYPLTAGNNTGCAAVVDRAGRLLVLHVQSGEAKYMYSRDVGATWGSSTTFQSGYQAIDAALDPKTGKLAVALYDEAARRWNLVVGELDDDGFTWSFGSPVLIKDADQNAAGKLLYAAGRWYFLSQAPNGGDCYLSSTKDLDGSGGTWEDVTHDLPSGYDNVTGYLDSRDGMFVVTLFDEGAKRWYWSAGELNEAGDAWSFSSPALIFNQELQHAAAVWRNPDGAWRFGAANPGNQFKYGSRTLGLDGSGTWFGVGPTI